MKADPAVPVDLAAYRVTQEASCAPAPGRPRGRGPGGARVMSNRFPKGVIETLTATGWHDGIRIPEDELLSARAPLPARPIGEAEACDKARRNMVGGGPNAPVDFVMTACEFGRLIRVSGTLTTYNRPNAAADGRGAHMAIIRSAETAAPAA